MDSWVSVLDRKPSFGQDVIIFRQWYASQSKHYSDYHIATYIKNPYDRRRGCFVQTQDKAKKTPMFITRVTHWMPLPHPPEKISIDSAPKTNTASMVAELSGSDIK